MNKDIQDGKEEEVFCEEMEQREMTEEDEECTGSSFSSGSAKEKKLKEKIKVLEKEKTEYLDGWQRARAEMVNIKKNHLEEKKLFTSLGKEALLSDIVPVLDNFDAAFSNKEAWEKVDPAWRSGVEYIYSQFKTVLENNGVEQFGQAGEKFDETLHLSVDSVVSEDKTKDGSIESVLQRGYKIGEKVLREAKVKVYSAK